MEPLSSSCPPRDVSAGPSLSSGPGSSKHCPGRQEELVSLPSSSPPVEVASGLSSSSAALTVQGKLFVGGISSETGEALLVEHFAEYGELREVTVIRDRITGNSRGFGFVRFVNPDNAESALKEAMHVIDGKTRIIHANLITQEKSKKILFSSVSSEQKVINYCFFGIISLLLSLLYLNIKFNFNFGSVMDAVVMYNNITQRPRGFGFVTFSSEDSVAMVLKNNYHELKGKFVDVKVAIPKNDNNYTNNRNNNNYGSSSIGGGGGRRWPIYDAYQGCYHATHGYCGPGSCGITLYGYQFVSPLNDPRWMPTLVTYYPYVMGGSGSNMPAHDHLLFHASDDSNGDYCYTNGDTLK
ncbi:unnamed protein product [Musa acuminata subsp. malaccensis]|uniref:(wild Malaysian banana) hypothetical protein n=1 Tax=Musa acuminata subsp. malaccensis TaxID=214687 RepID=A0A8D7FGU9_MUSAM|nr:unnamed protein product [Musa acuminata subsp. malaccensis]